MSENPFKMQMIKLGLDGYSFRREIIPDLTTRGTPPAQAKFLPEIFEDSHPWPLQWGGPEVAEGRFYGAKDVNAGGQKRVENAALRMTEHANESNVRIRATAEVRRYPERNLLSSATYQFEAVVEEKGGWKIVPLGGARVEQSLTREQRIAIVEGTLISNGNAEVLEYRHKGKVVKVNTKRLLVASVNRSFVSIWSKLGDVLHALPKMTPVKKTPREKAAHRAERTAIKEADKEAAQRTAAPPVEEKEMIRRGAEERQLNDERRRATAGGRPTDAERGTVAVSEQGPVKTREGAVKGKPRSAQRGSATPGTMVGLASIGAFFFTPDSLREKLQAVAINVGIDVGVGLIAKRLVGSKMAGVVGGAASFALGLNYAGQSEREELAAKEEAIRQYLEVTAAEINFSAMMLYNTEIAKGNNPEWRFVMETAFEQKFPEIEEERRRLRGTTRDPNKCYPPDRRIPVFVGDIGPSMKSR